MTDTLIKLRRSAVPGKTPTDAQMQLGEVAINTYDGKMFFKQSSTSNSILQVATTNLNLSQFAVTTSSQLASIITDETGTGSLVFASSPSLISPIISGNTSFDSGTFFIDSLNDRVGVGITAPTEKLHVSGNIRITGGIVDSAGTKGSAGQVLTTNGTTAYWAASSGGGGGSTNLSATANSSTITILSDTGTDVVIEGANTTVAGIMTAEYQILKGHKLFANTVSIGTTTFLGNTLTVGGKLFSRDMFTLYKTGTTTSEAGIAKMWVDGTGLTIGITGALGNTGQGTSIPVSYAYKIMGGAASYGGDEGTATGHRWNVGAIEAMRLDSTGRLGLQTTNPQEVLHANGNIYATGSVGIGGVVPSNNKLFVSDTTSANSTIDQYGIYNTLSVTSATASVSPRNFISSFNDSSYSVQQNTSVTPVLFGSYNTARIISGSNTSIGPMAYGSYNLATNQSTTSYNMVTGLVGSLNQIYLTGANSMVGTAYATYSDVSSVTGSKIGTSYMFFGSSNIKAGTINNNYGLYISNSAINYVAGGMQVGGTAGTGSTSYGLGVGVVAPGIGQIATSSHINIGGGIYANNSLGISGQVLTSTGTDIVWTTPVTSATNLTDTANSSTVTILSDTGTDAVVIGANSTTAGIMTAVSQTFGGQKTFSGETTFAGAAKAATGIIENSATIASNYTISTGYNAMSSGPITINSGVSVTVPTGSSWTII